MDAGVYQTELGSMTEISVIAPDGRLVKRVLVRTDLLRTEDVEGAQVTLGRVLQRASLRIV
jgi:hypothetical protein